MTCPMSWKNPVHLMYLKATIVSSLVDNLWVYMGKFICRCTLFNPLHIPGLFLPTFRVLYKRYFVSYFRIIYQIFYGMTSMLCWYVICLFILCGIILCCRQGSKVEQFHWLVIPCINIFEIKNKIWLDHRFKHGGCKASVKCQVRNILFVASQTVFTSLDIWVKSTNNAWSNKCVWPPCNKLEFLPHSAY